MKRSVVLALALVMGAAGGCGKDAASVSPAGKPGAVAMCPTHRIADAEDPFCHKELVAKLGECKEHGVPEALCWKCKPSLITAYKMEGDWCGEHGLPESKCTLCSHK